MNHERGFALCSMRSKSRSRYYLQCRSDEHIEDWPDDKFWEELDSPELDPATARNLQPGASIEKSIAPLRSFVAEPMRLRQSVSSQATRHILYPPTGAKGLNLAASDVGYLLRRAHRALQTRINRRSGEAYADRALARVSEGGAFLLVDDPDVATAFRKPADLIARSALLSLNIYWVPKAAQTSLAENYVGLPYWIWICEFGALAK